MAKRRSSDKSASASEVAVGMLLLFGVTAIGITIWEYWSNRHSDGYVDNPVPTSAGVLGIVGVAHAGEGSGGMAYRVSLIDVHSGVREAVQVLGGWEPRCGEFAGGLLWCRSMYELELLSLPSLEVRADWKAVQAKIPEMAVGLDGLEGWFKTVGDQFLVGTKDGRRWLLSADPLKATAADAETVNGAEVRSLANDEDYHTFVGDLEFGFGDRDGQRQRVALRRGGQDLPTSTQAAETYLRPGYLLTVGLDGAHRELSDPPAALVLHRSSTDREESHALLTRVDGQGRTLWMVDLGPGSVAMGVVDGDALVVVGNLPEGVAVSLDPISGAERWRTEF